MRHSGWQGTRWTTALLVATSLGYWVAGRPAVAQQGEEPCIEVLAQPERLAAVLPGVSLYASTYALIYPDRLAAEIPSLEAPALRGLRVGIYKDTGAEDIAAELVLTQVRPYPFDPANAGRVIAEVLAGDLDAAILWGPLAGLAVLELDLDYTLSLLNTGPPAAEPQEFQSTSGSGEDDPCAMEIAALLEGYGVVPAQQLVPVDIRDFLHMEAPEPDLDRAREGADLYAEHCAKCHGPQAVADPTALAPVDVLVSVRRFTYPGFFYIALNGRQQRGMPGFRGKLGEEELSRIYQYVRSRSYGDIQPSGPIVHESTTGQETGDGGRD